VLSVKHPSGTRELAPAVALSVEDAHLSALV
jgi:hypothetical protein